METLADRIAECGALPPEEAVRWVLRLALALEPLHRRGGAHGAVGAGSVRIASGPLGMDQLADPRLGESRAEYHCPERTRGGSISPSDDTWAVAVLLFHALTGGWPYSGETDEEVLQSIEDSAGARLSDHGVEDEALEGLLARALRPARMARVLMLTVFREGLEDWLIESMGEVLELRPLDLEGAVIDSVRSAATPHLDSHEVSMPDTRRLDEDDAVDAMDLEAAMKLRGGVAIDEAPSMPETRRLELGDIPDPPRSRPPSMVITPRSERPPPVRSGAPPLSHEQRLGLGGTLMLDEPPRAIDDVPPTLALPDVPPPPGVEDGSDGRVAVVRARDAGGDVGIHADARARSEHPATAGGEPDDEEEAPPTKISVPPQAAAPRPAAGPIKQGRSPTTSKRVKKSVRAETQSRPASGFGVRTYVAVGVVLGVAAGLLAAFAATPETPVSPRASAEMPVSPRASAEMPISPRASPVPATAEPVAAAASVDAGAVASAPSAALPTTDVSACVAPLFAAESFESAPDLSFVCEITDPRRGADRMREAVVRGGVGRKITDGMREWAVMGWFELASFAIMRAHCCGGAPPLTLPSSPGVCPSMADALNEMGRVIEKRGDDAQVDAAIDAYASAVRCLNRAGATKLFGGHPQLAGGEEPTFRKTLARVRSTP